MPKMKTKRAAAKRFKITSTGKILRRKAYKSHLLEWKASSRKRALGKETAVHKSDLRRVKSMMPGI